MRAVENEHESSSEREYSHEEFKRLVDTERALFVKIHDNISRLVYYLLAVNASAIAFSVVQTHDRILTLSEIPLLIALMSWGSSFYCGCQYLILQHYSLYQNIRLLQISQGIDPKIGDDLTAIKLATEGLITQFYVIVNRAKRLYSMQFLFLILGAFWFIIWHVLEMALRNPNINAWLYRIIH